MRRRRLLVSVPVLLGVAVAGTPAVATTGGPGGPADPGHGIELRLDRRGQDAAPGTRVQRHAKAADGAVRRTARLTEIEHVPGTTPQQQLAAVDVVVDVQAGTLTGTAALNAAPTDASAAVAVVVGTWQGSTCTPALAAVATGDASSAQGQVPDGSVIGASASLQGATVTIATAPHPVLRDTELACAYAAVAQNVPNGQLLSIAYPADLAAVYVPVLEVEPDEQMVGAKAGRWVDVGVEVRNTARGPASSVRLTASGKGIEIAQKVVDVGVVDQRSTEYVDLKVRLKRPTGKKKRSKALKPRTLTLTVTDPAAATATARTTVVVTPKPTRLRNLAGTYWWGWEDTNLQSSAGWINHAVWFVDRKWAYTGWADGRKPRCSAKVKECRRYSYDARTGRLKIGREKVKVTSAGFAFTHPGYGEKLRVEPLTLPTKGTKLAVDLYHQNWSGFCTISCTAYTDYLTMDRAGRFVEGGYSVGSWPGLGSSWATAPADQRGTYRVVSTGVIEMTYADGTRTRQVIGIQHDPRGKPNPAVAGVLLGETNFYD
ncbi:hypothetical protein [Nocardioides sp. zg-1228]|uniref:hypothetical protein n=1 Tax=Nocardioides sp. zg-1228 TaxID=2763008 RepID=UPI00164290CD|nr:hypothetical protein [Nocardioides sp. zg-1228]MBC2933283.1 hypothetical protein [Nocardioides sp. zg-1228]QSF56554.1 hypothetical protein JX575_13040 [Nocardioides sp. zg-1228]